MRGFNKVFSIIKVLCGEVVHAPYDCFEQLLSELNIDEKTLLIYLNILQNMQLITYDAGSHAIALTPLGVQTQDIPSTLS